MQTGIFEAYLGADSSKIENGEQNSRLELD
jgi:hypothetical protein